MVRRRVRLRHLLRGQVCQRESASPRPQLLGIVDRFQVLRAVELEEPLAGAGFFDDRALAQERWQSELAS